MKGLKDNDKIYFIHDKPEHLCRAVYSIVIMDIQEIRILALKERKWGRKNHFNGGHSPK